MTRWLIFIYTLIISDSRAKWPGGHSAPISPSLFSAFLAIPRRAERNGIFLENYYTWGKRFTRRGSIAFSAGPLRLDPPAGRWGKWSLLTILSLTLGFVLFFFQRKPVSRCGDGLHCPDCIVVDNRLVISGSLLWKVGRGRATRSPGVLKSGVFRDSALYWNSRVGFYEERMFTLGPGTRCPSQRTAWAVKECLKDGGTRGFTCGFAAGVADTSAAAIPRKNKHANEALPPDKNIRSFSPWSLARTGGWLLISTR